MHALALPLRWLCAAHTSSPPHAQLLRQLSAAAAVPLPSLPAKSPVAAPAPPRATLPAAANQANSPASQSNAVQADSQVRASATVTAPCSSDHTFCSANAGAGCGSPAGREAEQQNPRAAGCRACAEAGGAFPCHSQYDCWAHTTVLMLQQRIHDERQAKKAELERQREAARRIAMQQPPSVPAAAAEGSAMPPPPASSAALPAAGKSAVPVLPARLQQAMQVRMRLRSRSHQV